MSDVFLMGFDAWREGHGVDDYLKMCRDSRKYAAGSWRVLETRGALVSSLIVYDLYKAMVGVGSIATVPDRRWQGFAKALIEHVCRDLEATGTRAIFLFAEVDPVIYESCGFKALPKDFQGKHPDGRAWVCMMRSANPQSILSDPDFRVPAYF